MGRESVVIINPKGNNRDLRITAIGQAGQDIQLILLKPGKSYRPEKPKITLEEIPRRTELDYVQRDDGSFGLPDQS